MEQDKKCYKCWWIEKYGIDFLRSHGLVTIESIAKFLNVNISNFKNDTGYKHYRDMIKKNGL